MVWAKAAIERTAVLDLCAEGERDRPGLVVLCEGCVHLGVTIGECLEWATCRATLRHVDLVVAQQDFGVDDLAALWAGTPREFVKT